MKKTIKERLYIHLKKTYNEKELKQWFLPLCIEEEENNTIHVKFPHIFFAAWFYENKQDIFEKQLNIVIKSKYTIIYNEEKKHKEKIFSNENNIKYPFGNDFLFDTFITNEKNSFIIDRLKNTVKQKKVSFNPIILNGSVCTGKTHLLYAICNDIYRNNIKSKIFCKRIEDILYIYKETYSGNKEKARHFIKEHDFFFIDEIQDIQKYQYFQDELLYLFDAFYTARKQMIFCSSQLPSSLTLLGFLTPKFSSRLEGGLTLTLKPPDLTIRIQYIEQYCEKKRLVLQKRQVLTLAQQFSDFRFLQGILTKLHIYRGNKQQALTQQELHTVIEQTKGKQQLLQPEKILETVSEYFDLKTDDLTGKKRQHNITRPRQIAMYLCRELMGTSYPVTGKIFGGRDHSTVLYAVKKIKKLQDGTGDMNKTVRLLKQRCLTGH